MSINVPAILQDVENLSTELADVPEVANLKVSLCHNSGLPAASL